MSLIRSAFADFFPSDLAIDGMADWPKHVHNGKLSIRLPSFIRPEDLKVRVSADNSSVLITSERRDKTPNGYSHYKMEQSYYMPDVDKNTMKASLKQGVLTIEVEPSQTTTIPIEVTSSTKSTDHKADK